MNARWCEITGLTPAEALGEGWARALHPDDRERVFEEWGRATREERAFESEYRFLRPDGTVVPVLGQALPERDARGGISGFIGTTTDLTRHIQVESELRASEEHLRLALDVASEGVWDWDVATGAIYLSPGWHQMLGYEPGEVEPDVGALASLIHPEDRPHVRDRVAGHLEGRTPVYEYEHRLRTASGAWHWNLHRGRVVERDAAGKPLRMLGVDIDIETQKRAEAELELGHEQLRRLALQVTLAEEHERRRIAQGLHDEVGQLLAIVRAKLGELLETGAPGKAAVRGDEIRALLDRAIGKTRSLTFELSSPVLHELGLGAAVESLCEQLGKESGVCFRVEAEREPSPLAAELRVLLYRAVQELCLNVVKHARAPRAEVRLHADGDRLRIVVTDDGEGFDASEGGRRFGPAGGFGLFAIREMSGQVGGRFEIESAPGKGTRAVLSVPLG